MSLEVVGSLLAQYHKQVIAEAQLAPKSFHTYKRTMAVEILGKLILKGKEGSDSCLQVCKQCLTSAGEVESVTWATASAMALDELSSVWKALCALIEPTPDPFLENLMGWRESIQLETCKHLLLGALS